VIGMTMANAKEFAGRNVKVNAVCPGFIESDMTAELNAEYMEEVRLCMCADFNVFWTAYSTKHMMEWGLLCSLRVSLKYHFSTKFLQMMIYFIKAAHSN
jgi:NAD(P)-dependent dehydrogenase (short-subunit alcohol dehydrogenase family)